MNYNLMQKVLLGLIFTTSALASKQPIDLTYPFDDHTIYWPTEKGFHLQTIFDGMTPKHFFYSAEKFCAPEHGGTHIDAPRHFAKSGRTVDEIPMQQLFGNAVVIDLSQTITDKDYAITVKDIQTFEKNNRPLTSEDIVLFHTGWGKHWGNKKAYLGTDRLGDVTHLHFPGLSKEAAAYLVDKKVKAVGLDTPSLDPGIGSTEYWAHRILLSANIYGLENVAHLDKLPPTGSQLIVAPMKIAKGSGAPTRIYAMI